MKIKPILLSLILATGQAGAAQSGTVKVTKLDIQEATKQAICQAIYGSHSNKCPGGAPSKAPYKNLYGFMQEQILDESTTDLDTTWASQEALTSSSIMNPGVPNDPSKKRAPSVLQSDLDAMWTGSGSVIQSTPGKDDLFSGTLNNYYATFYPVFTLKNDFFAPKSHSSGTLGVDKSLANVYSRILALQYQIPNCISYIPTANKGSESAKSSQSASQAAKSNRFKFVVSTGKQKKDIICKTSITANPQTACSGDKPSSSNIEYTTNGYYCLAQSLLTLDRQLKSINTKITKQSPGVSKFTQHVSNIKSEGNTKFKIMDTKSHEELTSFKNQINSLVNELRPIVLQQMADHYRQKTPTARVPDMMSLLGKDNYDSTLPESYKESEKLTQCTTNLTLKTTIGLTKERQRGYLQNLTNFANTPDLLLPGYAFSYAENKKEEQAGMVHKDDTPVLAAGQLYNFKETGAGTYEAIINGSASIRPAKMKDIPLINSFRSQIKSVLNKDIVQFKADSNYFIAQKGFVMGNLYSLASPRSALYEYSCNEGKVSIKLTPAQAETFNATFRLRGSSTEEKCTTEKSWRCRVINESDSTSLLKEMLMTMAESREAQFKQYLLNEKTIASMALLHMQKISSSQNALMKSKRKKIKELTEEYIKGKASGGGDGASAGAEVASDHLPASAKTK